MALADWTLTDVSERIVESAPRLKDPVMASALPDEARQDTPIITGILQHLAILAASGPHRGKNGELAVMRRDLLVFLALRDLQIEKVSAARVRRAPDN